MGGTGVVSGRRARPAANKTYPAAGRRDGLERTTAALRGGSVLAVSARAEQAKSGALRLQSKIAAAEARAQRGPGRAGFSRAPASCGGARRWVPVGDLRRSGRREPADKPGSVGDSHSSRARVAARLQRPTREQCGPHHGSPIWPCSGWGLPCHRCYHRRGALLPHLFTLTRPLTPVQPRSRYQGTTGVSGRAVYFLWHFPWTHVPQALPGTLPCGARTFLPATSCGQATVWPTPTGQYNRSNERSTVGGGAEATGT